MKATVLGVVHRKGIAKKSGQAFDFAQVMMLRPVQPIATEKYTQTGHGLEVVEAKADPLSVPSFAGLKFPAEVELVTEARPSTFGELELVVTGVRKV